jgi:2-polyprenyl-3-methyl-5-hydroxy-6-metoxy-1,4-benzoquinol methylase
MKTFCPILGRETTTESTPYSRDEWEVVKCRETGFYFLKNPPSYENVRCDFEWTKSIKSERKRREISEPIFSIVSKASRKIRHSLTSNQRNKFYSKGKKIIIGLKKELPVTIIDIGCGGGKLLKQLSSRFAEDGFEINPIGIELSDTLSELAKEQLLPIGGDIIHANAIDGVSRCLERSCNLVMMRSFLEHERKPLELLTKLKKVLKPEGAIIIKVPNFACWNRIVRGQKWCGFRYPDHVNYFTPKTIKILAKEAKYSINFGLFDRFPMSDNMYAVLRPISFED